MSAGRERGANAHEAPAPPVGAVAIKTGSWSLGPSANGDFTVTCDSPQKAIGGGWDDPSGWAHAWNDRPAPDGSGWRTFVTLSPNAPGAQSGTLYAICLK